MSKSRPGLSSENQETIEAKDHHAYFLFNSPSHFFSNALMTETLNYLPLENYSSFAQASKATNAYIKRERLWAERIKKDFPQQLLPPNTENMLDSREIYSLLVRYKRLTKTEKYDYQPLDPVLFKSQVSLYKPLYEELKKAARVGNVKLCQWLTSSERGANKQILDKSILQEIAKSGSLTLAEWAYSPTQGVQQWKNDPEVMDCVAMSGGLPLLKWHFSSLPEKDRNMRMNRLVNNVAYSGNLHMLKWLLDRHANLRLAPGVWQIVVMDHIWDYSRTTLYALRGKNTETIRWLIAFIKRLHPTSKKPFHDERLLFEAALLGNVPILDLIASLFRKSWSPINSPSNRLSPTLVPKAAESGSIEALVFVLQMDPSFVLDVNTLNAAALSGNQALLTWLLNPEHRLVSTQETLNNVVKSDNLETFKWLLSQQPFLIIDQEILNTAALHSLKILQWLLSKEAGMTNILPNQDTLFCAVQSSNRRNTISYLLEWQQESDAAELIPDERTLAYVKSINDVVLLEKLSRNLHFAERVEDLDFSTVDHDLLTTERTPAWINLLKLPPTQVRLVDYAEASRFETLKKGVKTGDKSYRNEMRRLAESLRKAETPLGLHACLFMCITYGNGQHGVRADRIESNLFYLFLRAQSLDPILKKAATLTLALYKQLRLASSPEERQLFIDEAQREVNKLAENITPFIYNFGTLGLSSKSETPSLSLEQEPTQVQSRRLKL